MKMILRRTYEVKHVGTFKFVLRGTSYNTANRLMIEGYIVHFN